MKYDTLLSANVSGRVKGRVNNLIIEIVPTSK
ncbi:hypothetical protein BH11VER1_BH11VER1_24210 [soil metagenome]